jgi:hypothetical protein
MSRTWSFPSDYFVALEKDWINAAYKGPHFLKAVLDPRWPNADSYIDVPMQWTEPFSLSWEQGYLPASTGYLAFQIALTIFDEVHCLGLDLKELGHFDGSDGDNMSSHECQLQHFNLAAKRLPAGKSVYGHGECDIFPRGRFEEICK